MISRFLRRLVVVSLAGLVTGGAAAPPLHALSAADRADIDRVETYLNGIRSVQAGFLQLSSTGQVAEGRLYLQRPEQLRLDYKPPTALQIYANGYWLLFVDTELEEVTHVPLSSTPAGFLVSKRVSLTGNVTVTRVERGAGVLRVHVIQTAEPDSGHVVLTLSDRPMRLLKWAVVDALGIETQVSLIDPIFNRRIDDKLFEFDSTRFDRPGTE